MQVQQQFEYIFTSVIFLSFCLVSFHYFCGCVFQKNGGGIRVICDLPLILVFTHLLYFLFPKMLF